MQYLRRVGIGLGWVVLSSGCAADVSTRARTAAARDLSCAPSRTHIVDQDLGLYRIRGCGFEATYHCQEDRRSLAMRCALVGSHKLDEPASSKPRPGAGLAKSGS